MDKRQARLVEAMLRVAERRPLGLLLLGDGPERERLSQLGARLPRFQWLGFSKDRAEYGANSRVGGRARARLGERDVRLRPRRITRFGNAARRTRRRGRAALASAERSESYAAEARPAEIATAIERLLDSTSRRARGKRPVTVPTRCTSMDDHFTALFALYAERLARARHSAV